MRFRTIGLVSCLSLLVLPGCSWFLIGGVAAALYVGTAPEEEDPETAPAVFIATVTGPVSGDVDVSYDLSDPESDAAAIAVEFSTDGTTFQPATAVSGTATSGLATSPDGITHHFLWDSLTDIGTAPNSNVSLRITPSGAHGQGAAKTEGPFTVDNNGIPQVSAVIPTSPYSEQISITYLLTDSESDAAGIVVEWRSGGSGTYQICTQGTGGDGLTSLASAPTGTAHTFVWDSEADTTCTDVANVEIRITPNDTKQGSSGSSAPFLVENNDPPVVESVTLPSGLVTGTATVEYTLSDSHSDTSQVRVEFRTGATGSWTSATSDSASALSNLGTAPAPGVAHFFPWNSDDPADLQGEDAEAQIRIQASDDGGTTWGAWFEATGEISIRNDTAPTIQVGSTHRVADRGIIAIPYTLTDAEGDDVAILAEFRPFGGQAWRRATAAPHSSELHTAATTSGKSCVFNWDTARDGLFQQNVEFRLTASQGTIASLSSGLSLSLNNDGSLPWVENADMPTAREEHDGGAINGKLYAVGGLSSASSNLATLEEYDPVQDTWTTKTPMPTGRQGLACAVVAGKLYAIGGTNSGAFQNAVEEYDPVQDTWAIKTPMPTARYAPACAVCNGKIYVAGGYNAGHLATVEEYDPVQDTWASKSPMSAARTNLVCAEIAGKVYAAGGNSSSTTFDVIEEYDPSLDAWTTKTPMPTARTAASAAVAAGRLYVFGGYNAGYIDPVEEYDPVQDTWQVKTPMRSNRRGHMAATINGKIHVVGGGYTELEGTTEEYDPVGDAWTSRTVMPTARQDLGCATVGGVLYVIGGYNGTPLDVVEAYDPVTDGWTTRASMPTARRYVTCAAYGGKIYAIGGYGSAHVTTVEEYDPQQNAWTTKAPMTVARSFASSAVLGGLIYVIGGTDGAPMATVEAYDPILNAWTTKAPLPSIRTNTISFAVDGNIYTIGGYTSGSFLDAVSAYDPAQNTWTAKKAMPTPRGYMAGAVVRGSIFAIGGYESGILATTEEYIPAQDMWVSRPDMITARRLHCGANVGGRVYQVGGSYMTTYDFNEEYVPTSKGSFCPQWSSPGQALSSACLVAEEGAVFLMGGTDSGANALSNCSAMSVVPDIPATGVFSAHRGWTACAPMITARRAFGAVSDSGTVYALGGFDSSGTALSAMEEYDVSSDTWSASAATMPTARGGLGVILANGKIFAIGGDTGSAKTAVVEIFDISVGSWATGAPLGTARSHFALGRIPDTGLIYVFGGEGGGGALLDSVERYDPVADTWKTSEDTVDPLNTLPFALEGGLCLLEEHELKIFGGEKTGGVSSDRILVYQHSADLYRTEKIALPYAARDLFGATLTHSWSHRGIVQTDEFCLFGGGSDGTSYSDAIFRLYTR